jgi:hypothetical protein
MSYTFIFWKQFYFVISIFNIIGRGNPYNNLESLCMSTTVASFNLYESHFASGPKFPESSWLSTGKSDGFLERSLSRSLPHLELTANPDDVTVPAHRCRILRCVPAAPTTNRTYTVYCYRLFLLVISSAPTSRKLLLTGHIIDLPEVAYHMLYFISAVLFLL